MRAMPVNAAASGHDKPVAWQVFGLSRS